MRYCNPRYGRVPQSDGMPEPILMTRAPAIAPILPSMLKECIADCPGSRFPGSWVLFDAAVTWLALLRQEQPSPHPPRRGIQTCGCNEVVGSLEQGNASPICAVVYRSQVEITPDACDPLDAATAFVSSVWSCWGMQVANAGKSQARRTVDARNDRRCRQRRVCAEDAEEWVTVCRSVHGGSKIATLF